MIGVIHVILHATHSFQLDQLQVTISMPQESKSWLNVHPNKPASIHRVQAEDEREDFSILEKGVVLKVRHQTERRSRDREGM